MKPGTLCMVCDQPAASVDRVSLMVRESRCAEHHVPQPDDRPRAHEHVYVCDCGDVLSEPDTLAIWPFEGGERRSVTA